MTMRRAAVFGALGVVLVVLFGAWLGAMVAAELAALVSPT